MKLNDDHEPTSAQNAMCPSITKAAEHGIFAAFMLKMPEVTLGALHGFLVSAAELQREGNLGILESGNSMSTIFNALAVGMMKVGKTHANLNTIMKHDAFAHFRLGLTTLSKSLAELGYDRDAAEADWLLIQQHTQQHKDTLLKACKAMGRRIEGLEDELPKMGE